MFSIVSVNLILTEDDNMLYCKVEAILGLIWI